MSLLTKIEEGGIEDVMMAARSVFRSNKRAARTQGRERRKEMIEWLIQR